MQKQTQTQGRAALIWRFLQGSKLLFVLSMITASITALTDMLTPQIIRVTVYNVIGTRALEAGSVA